MNKGRLFNYYLVFLIILLAINLLFSNIAKEKPVFMLNAVSLLLPLFFTLWFSSKRKIFIWFLLYTGVVFGLILVFFRVLRMIFPPPKIGTDQIIGYAQYFGYPLNFETILVDSIIILPAVILFLLSIRYIKKT